MKKTQAKKAARKESNEERGKLPVALLKQDHTAVKELFEQFENTERDEEKEEIVHQTLLALKVHAKLEEELFYPAAKNEIGDNEDGAELLQEANEEHYVAKFLIGELENMDVSDENYCAKFTVLAENVKHHIEEEEGELFPKVKDTAANSEDLGARMKQRKGELKAELEENE